MRREVHYLHILTLKFLHLCGNLSCCIRGSAQLVVEKPTRVIFCKVGVKHNLTQAQLYIVRFDSAFIGLSCTLA